MKTLYRIGDSVYLKSDPNQFERIITGILYRQGGYMYVLICGSDDETFHFEFELSFDKDILKLTSN